MTQSLEQAWQRHTTSIPALDWMQPVRENALQAFAAAGFPTTRDEDWKYTSLKDFEARTLDYLHTADTAGDKPLSTDAVAELLRDSPVADDPGTLIVFDHGRFDASLSRIADNPGLTISSLGASDADGRALAGDYLGRLARTDTLQLAALNAAFLTDGLIVDLAPGTVIEDPVTIFHVSTGLPVIAQPRLLLRSGANSRLTLIEHFTGVGAGLTNAVAEMFCAPGAHVDYVKLQNESQQAHHVASQQVHLDRDSRFSAVHIDTGAALARNDLHIRLAGDGAEALLHGLFIAVSGQHVDHHTSIEHAAGNSISREHYRGIADAGGRGVFNGRILVQPGADGTDAELNNRNLLLDKRAEIDTKPELEIYADDVKCSHGATTGQLDENALFYLRSRGVSAPVARRMLISAFAEEIVRELELDQWRAYAGELLNRRLPDGGES